QLADVRHLPQVRSAFGPRTRYKLSKKCVCVCGRAACFPYCVCPGVRIVKCTRLFAALVLIALAATHAVADEGAKRPNILFAFADDMGRYASAYAKIDGPGTINGVVNTPSFDRLAREGV